MFVRNLQSLRKYRASLRTREGTLSIKAIRCPKCNAVNRTEGVETKHLDRYVEDYKPAEPSSSDVATRLEERRQQIATLAEMHTTLTAIKDLLEQQLTELQAINTSNTRLADALNPVNDNHTK